MSRFFAVSMLLALPVIVSAQTTGLPGINTSVGTLQDIINGLIPVAFGLAVLLFFWGFAKYIFAAGDEAAKEKGKNLMIWGVVAIFIMVSIWGIVSFLGNIFGINPNEPLRPGVINLPQVP